MSIVRRHHNSNFTIVPNAIFEDARLSIEAKGVLGYLLSRPHNWTVRLAHVAQTLMVGRDKMQRIFNELIDRRYVLRDQPRMGNQQWGPIEYVVFDQPLAADSQNKSLGEPQPAFPCAAEPQPAFPCAENTVAYKELKDNKTDSTKAADDARACEPSKSMITQEAFDVTSKVLHLQGLGQDDPRAIGTAYTVQGWLTKGWDGDVICQAIEIVMSRLSNAPRSLKYFETAIAEAHAERDRPLPVATINSNSGTVYGKRNRPSAKSVHDVGRELAEKYRSFGSH
jgi:hypothetical protein